MSENARTREELPPRPSMFLPSLLYLVFLTPSEASSTETECVWLPEKLSGRCWGLTEAPEYAPSRGKPLSADACEQLCCELGDKCVTYQWVTGHKKCYLCCTRLESELSQTSTASTTVRCRASFSANGDELSRTG